MWSQLTLFLPQSNCSVKRAGCQHLPKLRVGPVHPPHRARVSLQRGQGGKEGKGRERKGGEGREGREGKGGEGRGGEGREGTIIHVDREIRGAEAGRDRRVKSRGGGGGGGEGEERWKGDRRGIGGIEGSPPELSS